MTRVRAEYTNVSEVLQDIVERLKRIEAAQPESLAITLRLAQILGPRTCQAITTLFERHVNRVLNEQGPFAVSNRM